MRKLLSILSVCLVFVSYSQNRVHIKDLEENYPMPSYYQGELFTGIVYDTYDNGQLSLEGTMVEGRMNAIGQRWYENGQLKFKAKYKDNLLEGLGQEWYINGQLEFEGNFKNDRRDGLCKEWYSDGQLKSEEFWLNGQMLKKKEWNEKGELILDENYANEIERQQKLMQEMQKAMDAIKDSISKSLDNN